MSAEELSEHGVIDPGDFEILSYTPPGEYGKPTIIDADELEEARRDPRVHRLLREAEEAGKQYGPPK